LYLFGVGNKKAMVLSAKLELRQTQTLVITPQLQQAIRLLQLSNLELHTFLEREVEQNPFIEWDESSGEDGASKPTATQETIEPAQSSTPEIADFAENDNTRSPTIETGDADDAFQNAAEVSIGAYEGLSMRNASGAATASGESWLEDYVAQPTSLRDHLREQLQLAVTDAAQRIAGEHLIDQIDDTGYFTGCVEDTAERLGAPASWVEDVLSVLQSFEPAGVGARNLAECLAIQLRELNRYDPAMAKLLANLELLAAHDFAKLRRVCEVDQEDLMEMVAEIRALNPKPGLQFGASRVEAIVPDILIVQTPEGAWQVQLNPETLPRISINHQFYASAKRGAKSEKDKLFLQGCLSTANWLARSLDQRRRTMLKVAREILRQQAAFLDQGVRGLRPLSLRDIADKIAMHESTVSRVTSNKYMQTPRGTFELKYFFTSAINSAHHGESHSSESVKHRIKQLIEAESPRRVLSDDKIVDVLRDEGIEIARRTVAKYREMMRIPSSVQRRRKKSSLVPLTARWQREMSAE
jgi:RNA polymerase sigma-54 factor